MPQQNPPLVPGHRRATMRVRFFRERSLDRLEETINRWLAERPDREIVEIRQSITGESGRGEQEILIGIWFIED